MKLLFVMDPLAEIHIDTDSTFVMMLEAEQRGHEIYWCTTGGLYAIGDELRVCCDRVSVERSEQHYKTIESTDKAVARFDAICIRKDPPFDESYLHATLLLELVRDQVVIVNDPRGLREANEKVFSLRFSEWMPPTVITQQLEVASRFCRGLDSGVVIKPLGGFGGAGIERVGSAKDTKALASAFNSVSKDGSEQVVVQEFLPNVRSSGDKRLILIDGEIVGVVKRLPKEGDFRANIHVGGSWHEGNVTEREEQICAAIRPSLKKWGLILAGVDVIDNHLTEINVTSPTLFQELQKLSGVNAAAIFVDWLENQLKEGNKS